MAKAEQATKKVARPIQYDEVKIVTLELSWEEALFLSAVTGKIGGNPESSMRIHSDSIRNALSSIVGRRHFTQSAWKNEEPLGLYFSDYTNVENDTVDLNNVSAW